LTGTPVHVFVFFRNPHRIKEGEENYPNKELRFLPLGFIGAEGLELESDDLGPGVYVAVVALDGDDVFSQAIEPSTNLEYRQKKGFVVRAES